MSFVSEISEAVADGNSREMSCHASPSHISSLAPARMALRRYSCVTAIEERAASPGIRGSNANSMNFDSSNAPVPGHAALDAMRLSSLAEILPRSPEVSGATVPAVESVPDIGENTASSARARSRENKIMLAAVNVAAILPMSIKLIALCKEPAMRSFIAASDTRAVFFFIHAIQFKHARRCFCFFFNPSFAFNPLAP